MVDWVLGIHLLIMVVLVVAMVQLLLTYINVNRDDPLIKAAETATKENHGTRVVVSSAYYWEPMDTCPLGCKVQLKTIPGGIATYGEVNERNRKHFSAWAPLPTTRKP